MALPELVAWSQGLFLCPQHLQHAERYQESRLSERAAAAATFPWGVLELGIDAPALLGGSFSLTRLTCVLEDGMVLHYEDDDKDPPPGLRKKRQLADQFPHGARSLEVFVGVPQENPQSGTASLSATSDPRARYIKQKCKVTDIITTEAPDVVREREIDVAAPNASIYFGDELQRHDTDWIKIAEVVRGPSGQFELRKDFIPSCRRIGVSNALIEHLKGLRVKAIDKRDGLVDGAGSHDVEGLLLLMALEQIIPILEHTLQARSWFPPEALYLELVRAIGCLGAANRKRRKALPACPPFDYRDLSKCLFAACRTLDAMLFETTDDKKFLQVQMELEPKGRYLVARLNDPRIFTSTLFLAVIDGPPPINVKRAAKVGADVDVGRLIDFNLAGVPLLDANPPPPQLPAGRHYLGFDQNKDARSHDLWSRVQGTQTLALYLPPNIVGEGGIRAEWFALYAVL